MEKNAKTQRNKAHLFFCGLDFEIKKMESNFKNWNKIPKLKNIYIALYILELFPPALQNFYWRRVLAMAMHIIRLE